MENMVGCRCAVRYCAEHSECGCGGLTTFASGVFLGFGISFKVVESMPVQYTTAIIALEDGRVVLALPNDVQFVIADRTDLVKSGKCVDVTVEANEPDKKLDGKTKANTDFDKTNLCLDVTPVDKEDAINER